MPSGGYRKPSNPAPVSGPGKLSKRTDGAPDQGLPADGQYGYRKATREQMSSAPMAQDFQPTPTPQVNVPLTSMFAPTEKPEEPVTSGSPIGPGPGPEALNLPQQTFNPAQTLARLAQNDPSGQVESILQDLNSRGIQ
jgi:hypothetical protein